MKIAILVSALLLSTNTTSISYANSKNNLSNCSTDNADGSVYLQVLGSGGPELQDKLASTSYLIWHNGKPKIMIDAGSGSAANFGKSSANAVDLETILFSHFHTDHSADFATIIKSSFFEDKSTNLNIYGPDSSNPFFPNMVDFAQLYIGKNGVYPYLSRYLGNNASYQIIPHNIKPTNTPNPVNTSKKTNYKLFSINAEHGPVPSLAWRVEIAGKSISFSGDNGGHSDYLANLAKNSDLLVMHNAIPNGMTGFVKNLHMAPERIGVIANQANAKEILISHFMQRTINKKEETKKIIKHNYSGKIMMANDLQCYKI